MTATFLHPADADLAAMNVRANSLLTAEGAEAWYRNDIPWLLQEVAFLRSEIESARQWFYETSGDNPGNIPLTEAAYWWQQNVTGIWEKQQVRKLRDQIAELKSQMMDQEAKTDGLALVLNNETVLRQEAERLAADLRQKYDLFNADVARDTTALITRITELDDVIAQLRNELNAERQAGERNMNMTQALVDEKVNKVREALQAALAAID